MDMDVTHASLSADPFDCCVLVDNIVTRATPQVMCTAGLQGAQCTSNQQHIQMEYKLQYKHSSSAKLSNSKARNAAKSVTQMCNVGMQSSPRLLRRRHLYSLGLWKPFIYITFGNAHERYTIRSLGTCTTKVCFLPESHLL
jgi:hypothetical protein